MSTSERGSRLQDIADLQIRELIELLSVGGEATLSLPCPARAKLGDGTVAALALHTPTPTTGSLAFLAAPTRRRTATPTARRTRICGACSKDCRQLKRLSRCSRTCPIGSSTPCFFKDPEGTLIGVAGVG